MAAALHARLDLVHLFLDIGALPWAETLGRHSPPMNAIGFAKVSPCVFVHSKKCTLGQCSCPLSLLQMHPQSSMPGSPSAQIVALLQSNMPTVDSTGCAVDRSLLCKHPHSCLVVDPEEGDLCCTACSLVLYVSSACSCCCLGKILMQSQAKKNSISVPS